MGLQDLCFAGVEIGVGLTTFLSNEKRVLNNCGWRREGRATNEVFLRFLESGCQEHQAQWDDGCPFVSGRYARYLLDASWSVSAREFEGRPWYAHR